MKKDWLLVTVAVMVSGLLLTVGRGDFRGTSWVEVTIVPSDATAVACAGGLGNFSCAFDREGRPVETARPLRPFVTTAGRLVLLPGLFEEEVVANWLAHPRSPTERVRVRCESHRLADELALGIRFAGGDSFGTRVLTLADIRACSVH